MLRLRWFEPEPDDRSTPVDWRWAALIVATLFLNFPFWYLHGADLWMSCALPLYALRVGAVALIITALFFVGPALAAQASKRPLFGVIESSLGSIPTYGLRVCCVLFLVLWMAKWIGWPGFALTRFVPGKDVSVSLVESGALGAGISAFILFTGLQSLRTTAKLALFTNKLGLAILIAALIRVHRGLPAALKGYPSASVYSDGLEWWQGLSQLAFFLAPLAFLAAGFGWRGLGRKPVVMTAVMGIVVPLTATLLLVGIIDVATLRSGLYVPSVPPTIAMALWSHAANSAWPPRMMVAAITAFGAARFGIGALVESASIRRFRNWRALALFAGLGGAVAWFSADPFNPTFDKPFDLLTDLLAITAAVLTADFIARPLRADGGRRFDWVGVGAVVTGLLTILIAPAGRGSLLPSYATAFLACLLGRSVQRIAR